MGAILGPLKDALAIYLCVRIAIMFFSGAQFTPHIAFIALAVSLMSLWSLIELTGLVPKF